MNAPMPEAPDEIPNAVLPRSLRLLQGLVMVLMTVMIVGFAVLIYTLVARLNDAPVPLPETIALPAGASAIAVTQGPAWFGVVTDQNQFLVFAPDGTLRQTVDIISEE